LNPDAEGADGLVEEQVFLGVAAVKGLQEGFQGIILSRADLLVNQSNVNGLRKGIGNAPKA